jgi:hypothetical protein
MYLTFNHLQNCKIEFCKYNIEYFIGVLVIFSSKNIKYSEMVKYRDYDNGGNGVFIKPNTMVEWLTLLVHT